MRSFSFSNLFFLDEVLDVENAVAIVDAEEGRGEYDADNGHELHHDVQRGPRGVLQGVSYRVTHDRGGVRLRALAGVQAHAPVVRLDGDLALHDLAVRDGVRLLVVLEERLQPLDAAL